MVNKKVNKTNHSNKKVMLEKNKVNNSQCNCHGNCNHENCDCKYGHACDAKCALSCRCGCLKKAIIFQIIIIIATVLITLWVADCGCKRGRAFDGRGPRARMMDERAPLPPCPYLEDRREDRDQRRENRKDKREERREDRKDKRDAKKAKPESKDVKAVSETK